MRATIKTYSTNATIFYGEEGTWLDVNYDFPECFETQEEEREWIDDQIKGFCGTAENYEDIVLELEIQLDRFRK